MISRMKRLLGGIALLVMAAGLAACMAPKQQKAPFLWDNATVYFLLTDRFSNGNPDNDAAYARGLDSNGQPLPVSSKASAAEAAEAGSFHGGDFAGITEKLREGYFDKLGVNALWITPPFEQIHGYRSGDGFPFYAFHGYWALDFTQPDASYGTEEEFRTMVDEAHKRGIRIVLDVVLNHPGYATMGDAAELGFGTYADGWEDYYYYSDSSTLSESAESSYLLRDEESWRSWWGADWIRTANNLPGYQPGGPATDEKLLCLAGLPDFRTESTAEVALPPLLAAKWEREGRLAQEQAELSAFFEENSLAPTVLNYQIKWITDWVRDYGIDGFRCDTAKHIELSAWELLKQNADSALTAWRGEHPGQSPGDEPFWMVGEVWDHGVKKDSYYTESGFDALINFSFSKNLSAGNPLAAVYELMAERLHGEDPFQVLSYLSSHDVSLYDREDLYAGGNALLMAPGAVQVFYGDESARPRAYASSPYSDLRLRGDMNWDAMDEELLAHWRILGSFRAAHPSVGAGTHTTLSTDPLVFSRVYRTAGQEDAVIIAFVEGEEDFAIDVSSVFTDGSSVRNAYDRSIAVVREGNVRFSGNGAGIILLEAAR